MIEKGWCPNQIVMLNDLLASASLSISLMRSWRKVELIKIGNLIKINNSGAVKHIATESKGTTMLYRPVSCPCLVFFLVEKMTYSHVRQVSCIVKINTVRNSGSELNY